MGRAARIRTEFKQAALTECQVCHGFANFSVQNLGATKYDHDKTDYPISGFHTRNKCITCHEQNIKDFTVKEDFSDCDGCHQDSHKSVISAKRDCNTCHKMKVRFRKTTFDHGKETRWPIRGEHKKNRCKDCHKIGSKPVAPNMNCITCHTRRAQGAVRRRDLRRLPPGGRLEEDVLRPRRQDQVQPDRQARVGELHLLPPVRHRSSFRAIREHRLRELPSSPRSSLWAVRDGKLRTVPRARR